jgi:integrase
LAAPTIPSAIAQFLAHMRNVKKRSEATIGKYEELFADLQEFTDKLGLQYAKQLDTPTLLVFYSAWVARDRKGNVIFDSNGDKVPLCASTIRVRLERLRTFGKFMASHRWHEENPADDDSLSPPDVPDKEGEPYSVEEMLAILAAIRQFISKARTPIVRVAWQRIYAMTLLMRYAGMAISDALLAGPANLIDGCIVYRRLKTRNCKRSFTITVPLPAEVLALLQNSVECPPKSERYWFWSGQGELETAAKDASEMFSRRSNPAEGIPEGVYERAKIEGGHSHRFRHTFAVENLKAGVHPKVVARFMGHASSATTERYYSRWTQPWQQAAEQQLTKAHSVDPLLCSTDRRPVARGRKAHGQAGHRGGLVGSPSCSPVGSPEGAVRP